MVSTYDPRRSRISAMNVERLRKWKQSAHTRRRKSPDGETKTPKDFETYKSSSKKSKSKEKKRNYSRTGVEDSLFAFSEMPDEKPRESKKKRDKEISDDEDLEAGLSSSGKPSKPKKKLKAIHPLWWIFGTLLFVGGLWIMFYSVSNESTASKPEES